MGFKLSDFDYELPSELIAQYPTDSREESRMLILDRVQGEIAHKYFRDFIDYIEPGDILVLNDTKVINARLFGKRATAGKVEIFLLESIGGSRFKALIRPSKRIREGEEIYFDNSKLKARLLTKRQKRHKEDIIEFSPASIDIEEILREVGTVPLPPYIRRKAEPLDEERYQTVYAKVEGATASPTAGLHFTEEILKKIASKGAKSAYVTLHVNYGTFAPINTENVVDHKMHSESFRLTEDAAAKINSTKEKGGRVFAVGTTSCRVLETCATIVNPSTWFDFAHHKPLGAGTSPPRLGSTSLTTSRSGQARHLLDLVRLRSPQAAWGRHVTSYRVEAKSGETDLFIYPGYKFKIVDVLLTNFHLPKSTLLLLVSAFAGDVPRSRLASADSSAFAGKDLIFKAYKEAIARKYRFFSYGDCMLII